MGKTRTSTSQIIPFILRNMAEPNQHVGAGDDGKTKTTASEPSIDRVR